MCLVPTTQNDILRCSLELGSGVSRQGRSCLAPVYLWKNCNRFCLVILYNSFLFVFQKLTLLHVNSNQCLDKATEEDSQVPSIRDCNGSRSQQWLLRNVTLPEIF